MKLSHKIYYTSGQVGMMLATRYIFQWIISFSPTILFSTASMGSLIFIFRIYDAGIDPFAGYFCDNYTKISRIKLMNYSIPIFALGLALCFFPDPSMNAQTKWIIEFIGMLLFFTGYTLYCLPYWGLVGDYSQNDPAIGRTLSNLLGLGLLLATAIGFIVTPILVNDFGYKNGAIITALFSAFLMSLPNLCPKVHRLVPEIKKSKNMVIEIFSSLLETYKNKKFLLTCILFIGSQMSLTIMTAAAPFIATHVLGGKNSDVAFLMGPMLLVAFPSFYLSQKLSKLWGWEKSVLRATMLLGILYFLTSTIGIAIIGSPMTTAALMFSLSGLPIAILLGLEAEAVTFCAKESNKVSTHFAAITFLIQSFNGLALMITGVITENLANVKLLPAAAGSCLFLSLIIYYLSTATERSKSTASSTTTT